MFAAVMTTMTMFEFLVNCFLGFLAPMGWAHLSIPHLEKKGAKPSKPAARSARRKLLFRPELLEMFGVTAPTIWLWQIKLGFPHAIIVGGRSAWYADEVDAWIAARPRRRLKGDPPTPSDADE
jgi:predicted DNA-binding transcriptional regulator AlpA